MKTLLLLFIKVVIAAIIIGAVMYIEQFFSGFGVMAIYIMAFISFILPTWESAYKKCLREE